MKSQPLSNNFPFSIGADVVQSSNLKEVINSQLDSIQKELTKLRSTVKSQQKYIEELENRLKQQETITIEN